MQRQNDSKSKSTLGYTANNRPTWAKLQGKQTNKMRLEDNWSYIVSYLAGHWCFLSRRGKLNGHEVSQDTGPARTQGQQKDTRSAEGHKVSQDMGSSRT